MIRRSLAALGLALAVLLGAPSDAHAQGAPVMPSAVPSDVAVGVVVIRATTSATPRLDARLASWGPVLAKVPFQAFDLVAEHRWRLHDGQRQEVVLPDGRTTLVTLAGHGPEEARVALSSRRPGAAAVDTELTIKRDRSFLYVLRTGADSALLLRVDVRY